MNMSKTLDITTRSSQSYKYQIGSGRFTGITDYLESLETGDAPFVVIDDNVWNYHRDALKSIFDASLDAGRVYHLEPGEARKSMQDFQSIVDFCLDNGVQRSTPLFAVGGGVTGDLAGYAAASVMRGIPLVHVPTTLLAMVDSSIGGKTGINHQQGKNLIGAFYQPHGIIVDTDFLTTLPEREWINGISEILKYGAISDTTIFDKVSRLVEKASFRNADQWVDVILQSARIKVDIVEQDTLEGGIRAFLNFGHTYGHAMEAEAGYGKLAHGEAVYAGMIAATYVSNRLGSDLNLDQLLKFKSLYDFDITIFEQKTEALIERMRMDKKAQQNDIRVVVLNHWQDPYLHTIQDEQLLRDSWDYMIDQLG